MGIAVQPKLNLNAQRRALYKEAQKWAAHWHKALLIPLYWEVEVIVLDEVEQDCPDAYSMQTTFNSSYNWATIKVQPTVLLNDVPWMMLHEMLHVVHARLSVHEDECHIMESTISHLTTAIWGMYKRTEQQTKRGFQGPGIWTPPGVIKEEKVVA